jgi:hypothetical protein
VGTLLLLSGAQGFFFLHVVIYEGEGEMYGDSGVLVVVLSNYSYCRSKFHLILNCCKVNSYYSFKKDLSSGEMLRF